MVASFSSAGRHYVVQMASMCGHYILTSFLFVWQKWPVTWTWLLVPCDKAGVWAMKEEDSWSLIAGFCCYFMGKKWVNSQEKSHYYSQTTVVPPRVSRSDPRHSRGWCLVPTGFPSKNWSKNQSKDSFQSSTLTWHIWRNCSKRLVKLYCRLLTISGYAKVFTLGGKQRLPYRCGVFFRCVFLGCDFVAWKFEVVRLKVKYSGLGGVWVHLVVELKDWCATLLPSVRRVRCLLQTL